MSASGDGFVDTVRSKKVIGGNNFGTTIIVVCYEIRIMSNKKPNIESKKYDYENVLF